MTSISGYQKNRSRYGSTYWEHRAWLAEFDTWPLEAKLNHQAAELRAFIAFAVENSAFYRDLYASVDLDEVRGVQDLPLLPVVDKEMLRSNIDTVMTIEKRGAVEGHTGGTTGKSLVVRNTPSDAMKRMALLDHFKHRVGFEHRTMRRATFNGKHIVPPRQRKKVFWRYNAACRQMIYSSFNITEENVRHYVDSLNKYKPHAIDGFFTSMCDVASYIERNNVELTFRPIAIFPTSETVTDSGRSLLERVFGCPVYNQYASSEGAPFVTECTAHALHVELSSGVFEPLEEGNDEVLVTSFTTHGTPLIRYRIGDAMTLGQDATCTCGVESPTVGRIEGRNSDFLYRADGAKINGGNVANLFKNMPNVVIRSQAIQREIGAVTLLLEVDSHNYRLEYDDLLRDEFRHVFGSGTRLDIQLVDSIPRSSSGKHRMIENYA